MFLMPGARSKSGRTSLLTRKQSANQVLVGPASGAAAQAAFRTLVAADLINATAYKIGSFSRDVSLASGSQAVTGIGFMPKMVVLFGGINNSSATSWGASNVSSNLSIYNNGALTANTWGVIASFVGVIEQGGGNQYLGVLASLDADGFTVSWTRNGAPTGTATWFYFALR